MLRQMRSGALSGFFLIFLLLGGVGLVLTDWSGAITSGVAATSVAEVNGQEITYTDFDNRVRQFLFSRNISPEMAYQAGIIDQLLKQQIEEILLQQKGKELGLQIPDYLVAERIRPVVNMMTTGGLSKEEALGRLARENGVSVPQLINNYRLQYIRQMLFDTFRGNKAQIPDIMAKRFYQYKNEQRDIAALYLANSRIKDIADPTEEELKEFYDSRKSSFIVPETRILNVGYLTPDTLEEEIAIGDEELKAEYEETIDRYVEAEGRVLEQAIVETEKQAKAIKDKASGQNSLKTATKEVTGSEEPYRKADSYDEAGLPPELSKVVFAAGPGKIEGPVKTPLGWHVIKLIEVTPERTKTFEEVKDKIAKQLKANQLDSLLIETANQLDDELAGGADLGVLAEKFDLKSKMVGPVNASGNLLEIKGTTPTGQDFLENYSDELDYLLENAFAVPQGEATQVLELDNGTIMAIQAEQVFPQSFRELESVKAQLTEQWISKERGARNFQDAKGSLDKLTDGDLTLKNVAKTNKVALREYFEVTRDMEEKDQLTENAIQNIFTHDEDDYFLTPVEEGFLLGKVKAVTLPDMQEIDLETVQNIRENQASLKHSEFTGLYVQKLADENDVEINRRLLNRYYGGGANSQEIF